MTKSASPGVPPTGLEVSALVIEYGPVRAVDGIDLVAPVGAATCIMGRNGAGKSSFLRGVTGMVKIAAGRVAFGSKDLTRRPSWDRVGAGIACVPEGSGVIGELTVLENLELGMYHRRLDKPEHDACVEEVLELFPDLRSRLGDPAGNLSGGQRQMVAVGRGLAVKPDILVLDEPSFGLAPLVVDEMYVALRRLVSEGMGILFSEQNATAAFDFADTVYVFERGKVSVSGIASQVRDDPRTTASLFA